MDSAPIGSGPFPKLRPRQPRNCVMNDEKTGFAPRMEREHTMSDLLLSAIGKDTYEVTGLSPRAGPSQDRLERGQHRADDRVGRPEGRGAVCQDPQRPNAPEHPARRQDHSQFERVAKGRAEECAVSSQDSDGKSQIEGAGSAITWTADGLGSRGRSDGTFGAVGGGRRSAG